MTATKLTPERALELAREVANDEATVGFELRDGAPVGIRVTGCFADVGVAVAYRIAKALMTKEQPGAHQDDIEMLASRRITTQAGFVCCWL
jgi:hypothetical protein